MEITSSRERDFRSSVAPCAPVASAISVISLARSRGIVLEAHAPASFQNNRPPVFTSTFIVLVSRVAISLPARRCKFGVRFTTTLR
jgi:hypothetical protein